MNFKIWALAVSGCVLAAGAAHAGEYGAPPYSVGGYAGYDGGGCEGFTLAGANAGVTVLGISVGGGASARIGGGCGGGYQGAAYASAPVYQGGYPQGGSYGPPAYAQPVYAPVAYPSQPAYAPPPYGYPQPGYGYGQRCGCQSQPPAVYQPY
jgi:hypothetical protein